MAIQENHQNECLDDKNVERTPHLKKDLLQRLNRIEGQIRGISRMVDTNTYCDDILHQILSVESALTGVKKVLLESHIKSCVLRQISGGNMGIVDELVDTVGKMMK